MTFFALIIKNLWRQPVRAGLTLLGITIAITTVVALGMITTGLANTADAFVRSGGADFMLAQEGAADLTFSTMPEETVDEVRAVEGVGDARGALLHVTSVRSNPFFFLVGAEPEAHAAYADQIVEGRIVEAGDPDEIVLGRTAAENLGAAIGDTIVISDHEFTVVGILESDVAWEEGGAFTSLETVQEITKSPDTITVVYVTVEPGSDPGTVAADVTDAVDGVVSITSSEEYGQVDQGFEMIDAANMAISLLAIVIGGIGVMNTMVMSVFERTREIGVLRAVGWSGSRVLRMVMLESVLLCVAAAVVGSLFGVGVTLLITLVPAVGGFVEPGFAIRTFVTAFAVALVVGLIGAAYPAIRATRLSPMEALRYE